MEEKSYDNETTEPTGVGDNDSDKPPGVDTTLSASQRYYQRNREAIRAKQKAHYVGYYARNRARLLAVKRHKKYRDWYESVRVNVLRGISTKTLTPAEQERWWSLFMFQVQTKYGESVEQMCRKSRLKI